MWYYMIDYRSKSKHNLLQIIIDYKEKQKVSFEACASAILEYQKRTTSLIFSPTQRQNLLETLYNYINS